MFLALGCLDDADVAEETVGVEELDAGLRRRTGWNWRCETDRRIALELLGGTASGGDAAISAIAGGGVGFALFLAGDPAIQGQLNT